MWYLLQVYALVIGLVLLPLGLLYFVFLVSSLANGAFTRLLRVVSESMALKAAPLHMLPSHPNNGVRSSGR